MRDTQDKCTDAAEYPWYFVQTVFCNKNVIGGTHTHKHRKIMIVRLPVNVLQRDAHLGLMLPEEWE